MRYQVINAKTGNIVYMHDYLDHAELIMEKATKEFGCEYAIVEVMEESNERIL